MVLIFRLGRKRGMMNFKSVVYIFLACSLNVYAEEKSSIWDDVLTKTDEISSSASSLYEDSEKWAKGNADELYKKLEEAIPAIEEYGYKVDKIFLVLEIGIPSAGFYLTKVKELSKDERLVLDKRYEGDTLTQLVVSSLESSKDMKVLDYKVKQLRITVFPLVKTIFYLVQ